VETVSVGRVPHPNVALFDVRVGFHKRVKLGIFRADSGPQAGPYSACFVIFNNTPTHISVTNNDDPP